MFQKFIDEFLAQRDDTWSAKNYSYGKYFGQLKGDNRSGKGIMYYEDGNISFGLWELNSLSYGKLLSKNGDFFEGSYSDDKTLVGVCFPSEGGQIIGSWVDSRLTGHCTKIFRENHPKGCIRFSGVFQNDLPNGIGMMVTAKGLYYGRYENGKQISDYRDIDNSLDSVRARIIGIVKETTNTDAKIKDSTDLFADLKISQLDFTKIIFACEGEFGFLVNNSDTSEIRTIGNLVEFVMKQI